MLLMTHDIMLALSYIVFIYTIREIDCSPHIILLITTHVYQYLIGEVRLL